MSAVLELHPSTWPEWLRGFTQALSSATQARAIADLVSRRLPWMLPEARVRLSLVEPAGELRLLGPWTGEEHLALPDHRWSVLASIVSSRVETAGPGERSIAVFPLVGLGAPVGVMEVFAPSRDLERESDMLEVVAAQLGMALAGVALQERSWGRARDGAPAEDPSPDDVDLTVAWIAHEIRRPLTAVRAALEVLTDRQASSTGRDLMARCTAELSEMSRLVDDILHWGIVGESPRPRRLDIVPIVRESVALCGEELGRHRFSFVAPDHAIAFVEPVQLRGAIINLLRNAALYSPDDGMIKAEVEVGPDRTSVIVRDSGPGIPADEHETIFLPYVRGSRAAAHAGKGLGLFIARRVAEASGGRLVLSTEGSTEFRLEVPRDGAA